MRALVVSFACLLSLPAFAAAPGVDPDPIAVVGEADYGLSLFLPGHTPTHYVLCQGENYPVQFRLDYAGAPGRVKLTATENLVTVVDGAILQLQTGGGVTGTSYDPKIDYGFARFNAVDAGPYPLMVAIQLEKKNLALDGASTFLSFDSFPRQAALAGQQAGKPYVHSLNSRCGFYE